VSREARTRKNDLISSNMASYDAIVVGAGPNGLAAAITLAEAGRSVLVREAAATPGGGARSAELTLPGFTHDLGSAVHPMGAASPFFKRLPLAKYGLLWIEPPVAMAHPFDDGPPALLMRSIDDTVASLGRSFYHTLMAPLAERWSWLARDALAPAHWPHHPLTLAQFGVPAMIPGTILARALFGDPRGRAWFLAICAHALVPLSSTPSAAFGMMLALAAHAVSWPIPAGGAQSITDALVAHFRSLGGCLETSSPVTDLSDLPQAPLTFLDVTPRQFLSMAGDRLPPAYRRSLTRYRYGPGAFKLDWALSAPIPWQSQECAWAGTVHLCGSESELLASERSPWEGRVADRPFVLLSQPSLFDPSRAPAGHHTAWAYCHVPNGSPAVMTDRIERQIERFAPGFRDCIEARFVSSPAILEAQNPNLIGGDIAGGADTLGQLFTRPTARWNPYSTPLPGVYLCSSSTPPGGGVHGMCGHWAARNALADQDRPKGRSRLTALNEPPAPGNGTTSG
jgi:phytoene dehydrogenase-like protein